jgi:hypothetical protein
MAKRRKKSLPVVLFWSKSQRRFIDSVERFHGLVNDLELVVLPAKRRKLARGAAAGQAAHAGVCNGATKGGSDEA